MIQVPQMPRWLMPVISGIAIFAVLIRYSATWVLIAVLLAWFGYWHTGTRPPTPTEIHNWVFAQDKTVIGLLVSSTLTVVGFVVAFMVARASWRTETKAMLRLEAANELHDCLHESSTNVRLLSVAIATFVDVAKHMALGDTEYLDAKGPWAKEQCDKTWATRTSIIENNRELVRLRFKHDVVLSSQVGGIATIEMCLSLMAGVIAGFAHDLPSSTNKSPQEFVGNLSALDIGWWERYGQIAEESAQQMTKVGHLVRSAAITDVFGMNIWRLRLALKKMD